MKTSVEHLGKLRGVLGAALIVVVTPAIWYGIYAISKGGKAWLSSDYIIALMSGWLATMMGVVVGLPVAIWLADRGAAFERRERGEEQKRVAGEMRDRILHTVKRELSSSMTDLEEMANGLLTRFHFNVGHWNALTSSGDLKWIGNLNVLDQLAEAYESLEVVNILADSWLRSLEAVESPLSSVGPRKSSEVVQRLAADAASDAMRSVAEALERVDAEIGVIESVPASAT